MSWQWSRSAVRRLPAENPLAILYYDYALTFAREVEHFWPSPYRTGSWVSVIFFLNRYLAIFGHIPILIGLIPSMSCKVSAPRYRLPCFISHVPSLKMRTCSSSHTFACGLTLTKCSWQVHHYSGYFGMALQLLVAGELPFFYFLGVHYP